MGTIRKPSKTTKTAPFPSSIPKHMTPIRVLWAWKNTSHIAAIPVGNATRTSTVSNTTRTTPQTVTPRFRPRTRIPPPRLTDPTSRPTRWSCKKGKNPYEAGRRLSVSILFFLFVCQKYFRTCRVLGSFSLSIGITMALGLGVAYIPYFITRFPLFLRRSFVFCTLDFFLV